MILDKGLIASLDDDDDEEGESEKREVFVDKDGALVICESIPGDKKKVKCWQLAEQDYAGEVKKKDLKLLGKFILADP